MAKKERVVEAGAEAPARAGSRDLETEAFLYISQKQVSAPGLAELLGVSVPTASRVVAQLRKSGVNVVSIRDAEGWRYEIREKRDWRQDPLVQGLGCVKRWKPEPAKSEDEIIYGD